MAPVATLAVAATAAAATTAAVAISATNLFQQNLGRLPPRPAADGPSIDREAGRQRYDPGLWHASTLWGATTQQGGLCLALKLPDGTWGVLPGTATVSGQVPGCFATRQQMVVNDEAVAPGQQPTGAAPMPLEEWDDTVINSTGQPWDIVRRVCRSARHRRDRPQPHHGRQHAGDKRRLLHARRTNRAQQSDPRDGSAGERTPRRIQPQHPLRRVRRRLPPGTQRRSTAAPARLHIRQAPPRLFMGTHQRTNLVKLVVQGRRAEHVAPPDDQFAWVRRARRAT